MSEKCEGCVFDDFGTCNNDDVCPREEQNTDPNMTSNNIVNVGIILEFDNGDYAITGTKNETVIDVCCSLLKFKRIPKKYFETYSLAGLDIEGDEE